VTSRSVNIAWVNVATNSPMASWLGRQLHHDHRDRQHQSRQRHHRCSDRPISFGAIGDFPHQAHNSVRTG
jgi:hypothetical protein